ncbi:MAG: ATP-binding cassette domain-containing protein [Alphaproteobacteria bacterium]|nr:ATP-binding cassette domain-containing protein [Alphaproteobacteria bacterium]
MKARIEARDVIVGRDGRILNGVSLSARAGEMIGLVGPNGAGKTTLLRALAGLEPVSAGSCDIDGQAAAAMAPTVRARKLSYLPQTRPLFWSMTVEAIVALGRFAYGAPDRLEGEDAAAVARAMEATGVDRLKARAATTLSGGEAARMHLARALAAEAPILLADEPTAALDPRHQLAIMKVLRARADDGTLVIAALHDLSLAARFCTRIILLANGRAIADDAPAGALTETHLASAFGVAASVSKAGDRLEIRFGD